ncbi:MAG TPA: B-box zinc finger protein [bacterium]|nr:B-box zinc finger protein [bacterium]
MADCFYHTGRPAVTRCKQCGRPLCGDCKIVKHGGIFCSEKCAETYGVFAERAEELEARRATKSGIPAIVKTVIFLIVLFIIYMVLKNKFR